MVPTLPFFILPCTGTTPGTAPGKRYAMICTTPKFLLSWGWSRRRYTFSQPLMRNSHMMGLRSCASVLHSLWRVSLNLLTSRPHTSLFPVAVNSKSQRKRLPDLMRPRAGLTIALNIPRSLPFGSRFTVWQEAALAETMDTRKHWSWTHIQIFRFAGWSAPRYQFPQYHQIVHSTVSTVWRGHLSTLSQNYTRSRPMKQLNKPVEKHCLPRFSDKIAALQRVQCTITWIVGIIIFWIGCVTRMPQNICSPEVVFGILIFGICLLGKFVFLIVFFFVFVEHWNVGCLDSWNFGCWGLPVFAPPFPRWALEQPGWSANSWCAGTLAAYAKVPISRSISPAILVHARSGISKQWRGNSTLLTDTQKPQPQLGQNVPPWGLADQYPRLQYLSTCRPQGVAKLSQLWLCLLNECQQFLIPSLVLGNSDSPKQSQKR